MLTKAVVRHVTKLTVEKSYLKVAKMHCTKMRIYSEDGAERPVELLLLGSAELIVEQIDGGTPSQDGELDEMGHRRVAEAST